MRFDLSGDRKSWLGIGAAGVVALTLLFGWAIPAHVAARRERGNWEMELKKLAMLKGVAKDIPSQPTLEDRREFRKWLDEQAGLVQSFFADRTALLEASGEGAMRPEEFKEVYLGAVNTQRRWLEQNKDRMFVPDMWGAFRDYPWMRGTAAPSPADYRSILRDYWARYMLYQLFSGAEVRVVRRLEVKPAAPLTAEFEGMFLQVDLSIAPERLTLLIEKLLTVSPAVTTMPVIQLERLDVQTEPGPLCSVQMDGHILLLRETPATPNPAGGENPKR